MTNYNLDIKSLVKFSLFLVITTLLLPHHIVFESATLPTFQSLQVNLKLHRVLRPLCLQGSSFPYTSFLMETELEHFNRKMSSITSETYFNNFIKAPIRKQLNSHFSQYIVFVGRMQSKTLRGIVDEEWLEQQIIDLGLEEYMLGTADIDEGFIIGFQFTTLHAKRIFIEWLANEKDHNLVHINPTEATLISFRIKPFPFGFTQTNLQTQLINYGTISNFKYTTKKFGSREILKNEIQFTFNIKEGIDRMALPCYFKHNNAYFALASRQLPPICSLCRRRGHGRLACEFCWCTHCNSKQYHIHECKQVEKESETVPVPLPSSQIVQQSGASLLLDADTATPALDASDFPIATEADLITPVPVKTTKSKTKQTKPILFYDSDSDTTELTEQEPSTIMETNVETSKRKLQDITTTTSEEDPGIKPAASNRHAKRTSKK